MEVIAVRVLRHDALHQGGRINRLFRHDIHQPRQHHFIQIAALCSRHCLRNHVDENVMVRHRRAATHLRQFSLSLRGTGVEIVTVKGLIRLRDKQRSGLIHVEGDCTHQNGMGNALFSG